MVLKGSKRMIRIKNSGDEQKSKNAISNSIISEEKVNEKANEAKK